MANNPRHRDQQNMNTGGSGGQRSGQPDQGQRSGGTTGTGGSSGSDKGMGGSKSAGNPQEGKPGSGNPGGRPSDDKDHSGGKSR